MSILRHVVSGLCGAGLWALLWMLFLFPLDKIEAGWLRGLIAFSCGAVGAILVALLLRT